MHQPPLYFIHQPPFYSYSFQSSQGLNPYELKRRVAILQEKFGGEIQEITQGNWVYKFTPNTRLSLKPFICKVLYNQENSMLRIAFEAKGYFKAFHFFHFSILFGTFLFTIWIWLYSGLLIVGIFPFFVILLFFAIRMQQLNFLADARSTTIPTLKKDLLQGFTVVAEP